jgi:hypothetical protein
MLAQRGALVRTVLAAGSRRVAGGGRPRGMATKPPNYVDARGHTENPALSIVRYSTFIPIVGLGATVAAACVN